MSSVYTHICPNVIISKEYEIVKLDKSEEQTQSACARSAIPVRLPGELRSSPEMRGALGPRLCFSTLMAVGVLT